jgi:hypothetical protein
VDQVDEHHGAEGQLGRVGNRTWWCRRGYEFGKRGKRRSGEQMAGGQHIAGRRVHFDAVWSRLDPDHLGAEFQLNAAVDGGVGNRIHDLPESTARIVKHLPGAAP